MCIRLADKKKEALVYKFWNLSNWKPVFLNQLRAAQSLLKLYTVKAIITVLQKNRNVYSLRAPWLDSEFQAEQLRLDALLSPKFDNAENMIESLNDKSPRATFSTVTNKLKGL